MKILTPPYPPPPSDMIQVRITRKVRNNTPGRGGWWHTEEFDFIRLTDTTLEEVYDTVLKALQEKSNMRPPK